MSRTDHQKPTANSQRLTVNRRVVVLTTGGTIAMRYDATAGGAVPTLSAGELAAALPSGLAEIEVEELANLPSSHFTLETLWAIRQRVAEWTAKPTTDAVVVTHGTDTLEETAYLLDLTVPGDKPMVLTGAMRTASDVGYEGYTNLVAAIRVAAAPEARGLGALVVLNDEVHAARHVTKIHTLSTAAFRSPGWGPVGRIEGDQVWLQQRLPRQVIECQRLEPRVALLKLAVGMDAAPLKDALARSARGVVIEALGSGRIPPWWLSPIEQAVGAGVVVVIASRCPSGRVWDAYGYPGAYRSLRQRGCLFAEGLNGQKARIKLMIVLAAAQTTDGVAQLWSDR